MTALDGQRLSPVDAWNPDVAASHRERARIVDHTATVDPLVVNAKLLRRLLVIEHRHLARAHDGEAAHLVRIEPAHVHVAEMPARKAEVEKHDVVDARLKE